MKNPFYLYTLPPDAPFCNREKELKELTSYAASGANVLIYSPRRYGKTSLVKKVQDALAKKGAVTLFADFFGVATVDDVAARLAKTAFAITHKNKTLWKMALKAIKSFKPVIRPDYESGISISVEPASAGKTGLPLLEETMESIGDFLRSTNKTVHIALDEFQEIVELKEALKIEATMRTHIQHHKASYFFIGSRRRVLLGIFNERQRPFFQSAINYEIKPLPKAELGEYVRQRFAEGGKKCSFEDALMLSSLVACHPYYTQKLAFFVYELPGPVTAAKASRGFEQLLLAESPAFEAIIQGTPLQQRILLRALAEAPTDKPFASSYLVRHRLGSVAGVQHSLKQLDRLDIIEKDKDTGLWKVVDPVLAFWLKRQAEEPI